MTEPFKFSDGQLAYTVEELISLCQKFPSESLEYLMREDFEKWLDYIGKSDVAAKARQIRQASLSDSDRIKQFITQCQGVSVSTKELSPKTPTSDVSKPEVPTAPTAAKVPTPPTEVPTAPTAAKVPAAPTEVPTAPTAAKVPTPPTEVPTAPTAAKVPTPPTEVPTASTAAKVPAAPTATKVPTTPTATAVPKASTATKKTNPLASLFQKLFGKK